MTSRKKQRGFIEWLAPIASVAGALIGKEGQEETNEANASINSAQQAFNQREAQEARAFNQYEAQQARAFNQHEAGVNRLFNAQQSEVSRDFNASEAMKNRDFQERMRSTQYQTAIGDMKAAGINPMLAFRQGGSGTPAGATASSTGASGSAASGSAASGSAASSGSMIPMQNATQAGVNGAIAAAQISNIQSQTSVNEAQAEKVRAETPQVIANTGQIKQQTTNLEEGLKKITEEIKNVRMDTLEKEERVTLIRAQQQLTNVQKELTRGNITFVDAQTQLHKVMIDLKKLDVPGAQNTADWENTMSSDNGNIARMLQTLKQLIGK